MVDSPARRLALEPMADAITDPTTAAPGRDSAPNNDVMDPVQIDIRLAMSALRDQGWDLAAERGQPQASALLRVTA